MSMDDDCGAWTRWMNASYWQLQKDGNSKVEDPDRKWTLRKGEVSKQCPYCGYTIKLGYRK